MTVEARRNSNERPGGQQSSHSLASLAHPLDPPASHGRGPTAIVPSPLPTAAYYTVRAPALLLPPSGRVDGGRGKGEHRDMTPDSTLA